MTKIDIYYDGANITKTLNLRSSANQTIDLPPGVDSDSIRVYGIDGPDNKISQLGFIYYPVNFKPSQNKPQARVIDKNDQIYQGIYISHDKDQVIIMQDNNKQIINKYRNLTILDNFTNDKAYIQLISSYNGTLHINYIVKNITWQPVSDLYISSNSANLILQLYAKINNNVESINNTQLTLVAGKLNLKYARSVNYESYPQARAMTMAAEQSPNSNLNDKHEIQKYEFEQNINILESITKLPLQLVEVTGQFLYYANLNQIEDSIEYGYKFITPIYIPSMAVSIINFDENYADGDLNIITTVDESPINSEVNIKIGPTSKIKIINDIEIEKQQQIDTDNRDLKLDDSNTSKSEMFNADSSKSKMFNAGSNQSKSINTNNTTNTTLKRIETNYHTIISNIYNYSNDKAKIELTYNFGTNKISAIQFKVDPQHIKLLGQLPPAINANFTKQNATRFVILVNSTQQNNPYRTVLKYTEQIYS